MTKAALKDCLGLPPSPGIRAFADTALPPRGCSQVPVPKAIRVFVAPPDSTAIRDPSLCPWTLISHVSQAECSPACSPAPATTQHFNYRWHLQHRLWASKNLSFCQNPGPLPSTDMELKSAEAGELALGLGDTSLQPEGHRQQQATAQGKREEGERGTQNE